MSIAQLFHACEARRVRAFPRGPRRRLHRRRPFLFEAIEPRVLLAADPILATIVDAVDDTATTAEDTAVSIDVLANDSDPSGLTIVGFTDGANGSVQLVGDQLEYTPDPDFNGTDTFTYTVTGTGGGGETAPGATVLPGSVALPEFGFASDPPAFLATDQWDEFGLMLGPDPAGVFYEEFPEPLAWGAIDSGFFDLRSPISGFFVLPNTTVDATTDFVEVEIGIAATFGTLQLEVFDIDGNPIGVGLNSGLGDGPHGRDLASVTVDGIHSFRVSRTALGVSLDDEWALLQVEFGDLTAAQVTDTATVTVTVTPADDPPVAVDDSAITAEDTPVSVSVLDNDIEVDGDPLTIASFTDGADGTVALVGNDLVYTPGLNFNGSDSFTYTIDDGNGGSDTATVLVSVTPVDDAPDAADDGATTAEDTPVNVDVLANDTDGDGDGLAITGFTNGTSGSVALVGDELVYTPDANFFGSDTFTYTVSDGTGGTDTATVAITVTPVNDAPDAVNDAATTDEDTPVVITVLPNDSDVEGDGLTVSSVDLTGTLGFVTINGDGTLTYDPDGQFESLDVGQTATDTFTYTVSDGNGGTDTAAVTVTITGVADGGGIAMINLEKYVKEFQDGCDEGGTAHFWKSNLGKWFGYGAGDGFEETFGVNVPGDPTLLQALGMSGTSIKNLMREATAALLNAAHLNVNYKFTEAEVVAMVKQAISCGSYGTVTNTLAYENGRQRDLSDGALSGIHNFGSDADTGPGLRVDKDDDLLFTYVLTNPGTVALGNIKIIDDAGTPGILSDDFTPHALLSGGFNVGDADHDGMLDPGEQWLFVKKDQAKAGQHQNIAKASGEAVGGAIVWDADAANYTTLKQNPCYPYFGGGGDHDWWHRYSSWHDRDDDRWHYDRDDRRGWDWWDRGDDDRCEPRINWGWGW